MVLFGVPSLVRKDGEVERIDRVNPMAAIGGLLESDSRQTPKTGVHTKLTLPVMFADSGSDVKRWNMRGQIRQARRPAAGSRAQ